MNRKDKIETKFEKRLNSNPFNTPDHYFDSLEDRIMGSIIHTQKENRKPYKVFQLLKPALGLAASFTLVFMLVYYPIRYFMPNSQTIAKAKIIEPAVNDSDYAYSLTFSLVDENSLLNAIFSEEPGKESEINSDEMLAYLSSGMNEVEIYSEIQN